MGTKGQVELQLRGWRAQRLMRELAKNEKSAERLARENNCAIQTIHNFRQRHAEEIADLVQGLMDDYDRIWFAQQYNRVMFLANLIEDYEDQKQAMVTEAEALTVSMREKFGEDAAEIYPPRKEWDMLCRSQAMYAKQLAEELGQLKQRAPASESANTVKVIHEVGVDMARAFPVKEPA